MAGGIVSAAGAPFQAKAAQRVEEFNVKAARSERKVAKQKGEFAKKRLQERVDRFVSRQRASIGASGSSFDGSPLLILAETAEDAALEAGGIDFETGLQTTRLRNEISLAKFRRRQAIVGGFLLASSSLIGAGAQAGTFNRQQPAVDQGGNAPDNSAGGSGGAGTVSSGDTFFGEGGSIS